MFGRDDTTRTDYYTDPDGKTYRSGDYKKNFSPLWLLPILLIPLALLVWGGAKLFQNNNATTGTVAKVNSPTPAKSSSGLTVGVGGGPETATSTPAAKKVAAVSATKPTVTQTPKAKVTTTLTPKPTAKTEVGVGGGPDVPSVPSTGHGW